MLGIGNESLRVTELSAQKSTTHLHLPFFFRTGSKEKFHGETPPEQMTPSLSQVAIYSLSESVKPGLTGRFLSQIGANPLGMWTGCSITSVPPQFTSRKRHSKKS